MHRLVWRSYYRSAPGSVSGSRPAAGPGSGPGTGYGPIGDGDAAVVADGEPPVGTEQAGEPAGTTPQ